MSDPRRPGRPSGSPSHPAGDQAAGTAPGPPGGPPADAAAAPVAGPEFRLVPLDCPTCGAAVAADGEDVVYYCTACRNGYRFDHERQGLEPVEVTFVSAPQVAAELYRPFWLLPAQVTIHRREAAGGGFSGLLNFFLGGGGGGGGAASGEGTFAVPAFRAPLAAVTALTRRYTERLPQLGEKLGERLTGGCYGAADARKLAHYALIASEVEKPDTLKDLRYEIVFGQARLLGVPFKRAGQGFADSLFGLGA